MFKQHTPDPNDTLLLPTRAGNTVCILYCAYFTAFIVLCILYKGHRLKHVNGDERDPYTQTPQTHPSMIPMMMLLEDVPKTHQTRDTENDDNFERYNRTTLCTFSKSANVIFLFLKKGRAQRTFLQDPSVKGVVMKIRNKEFSDWRLGGCGSYNEIIFPFNPIEHSCSVFNVQCSMHLIVI